MNKPFTLENFREIHNKYAILSSMVDDLNEIAIQWHSEQSGWVKCSDRLPTKEDADENGWVEIWAEEYGKYSTDTCKYEVVKYNRATHWRKIVKPEP